MTNPPSPDDPVEHLSVLYDARCGLCAHAVRWLSGQALLVPLDFVPAGSPLALARFPRLDHAAAQVDVTVVGSAGQVYVGPAAWIACLWATRAYRPLAERLARPSLRPVARAVVSMASHYRDVSRRASAPHYGGRCAGRC